MKKFLALIFLLNTAAFAGEGAGGHGGDPADIMQLLKGKRSQINTPKIRDAIDQYKYDRAVGYFRSSQDQTIINSYVDLSRTLYASYSILQRLNYPFNFPGEALAPKTVALTLMKLEAALLKKNRGPVRIESNVTIEGNEVMFRSNPETFELIINRERFLDSLSDGTGVETVKLQAARLATLFHEVLILNGLETSRSYPYSNEFALGLIAFMTDKRFGDWFQYARDKESVGRMEIERQMELLSNQSNSRSFKIYEVSGLSNREKPKSFRAFTMPKAEKYWENFKSEFKGTLTCSAPNSFGVSEMNFHYPNIFNVVIDGVNQVGTGVLREKNLYITLEDGSVLTSKREWKIVESYSGRLETKEVYSILRDSKLIVDDCHR